MKIFMYGGMRKVLGILLFLISSFNCTKAQAPDLNSLTAIWEDVEESDSARVLAYNTYIEMGFLFSRPDTSLLLAENLHHYARSNNYPRGAAQGFRIQGIANAIMGNYPEAKEYFIKAMESFQEIDYTAGVANSLKNIGNIYLYEGNRPRALDYAKKSLAMFEEIQDKEGIAGALNNIGHIYFEQENNIKALEYGERSLNIYRELGNKGAVAGGLSNLGAIYKIEEDYEKALEVNQEAMELYAEMGRENPLLFSNNGSIYFAQGKLELARENSKKALELYRQSGNRQSISKELNNLGFISLGDNKPQVAKDFCQEALTEAEEIHVLKEQKNACKCLYEAYKQLGDGNRALTYHEKMLAFDKSLQSEETAKKLQQMEFEKELLADSLKNEEEKLKVEMAYRQEVARKEKSRNIFMAGGLILLILAGGLYSRNRYVRKAKKRIEKEKDRSENLLLNILPAEIAQELKEKGEASARDFDMVSILFTDFKGFTQASEKLTAGELVAEINICFKAFDQIVGKHGIEKIKTIGDAYMAAGGLPIPDKNAALKTVLAGLEMQDFMKKRKAERDAAALPGFEMRVGIHTGPVVAGIVGVKKFQYDVWGDTVNTASRMESSGEVGKVNISEATYKLLTDTETVAELHTERSRSESRSISRSGSESLIFESRGKVSAKGKGEMEMFFVDVKP